MGVPKIGAFDGLPQRLLLGLLQRRGGVFIEARRVFAVRPEHKGEKGRRNLVMLGIGRFVMFGDGAASHFAGERGIAFRAAGGEPRRRARTHTLDGGANDGVGQRHPFGGADDRGNQAHVTTSFCGGIGKNTLVRD